MVLNEPNIVVRESPVKLDAFGQITFNVLKLFAAQSECV
jgi:hypothetical protein